MVSRPWPEAAGPADCRPPRPVVKWTIRIDGGPGSPCNTPFMPQQSSSSAAWVRALAAMFAARGVDTQRLFQEAGLDAARLRQAHMRFTSEEVSRLWRLAVDWTGDQALGLDRQLAARHLRFDIATQAMWPGPDLLSGLHGLSRYLELIHDAAGFHVEPAERGHWMVLGPGNAPGLPRQRVEFGLLSLLKVCRKVTQRPLRPQLVEFSNPEPADWHPYRMAFACPLRFGQASNRLLLSDEDLARPLASAASLFAVQERVLERRLSKSTRRLTTYRTAAEIVHRLHLGAPSRRRVAQALELKEAELEQRLVAEHTGWERLLDELRRELAQEYLAASEWSLARVPALVGFASQGEFVAACKRWFGVPPAAYRKLHAPAPVAE